jgi:hypothetical protein
MKISQSLLFRAALAAVLTLTLSMGCQRVTDMKKRMERKEAKEAAKKAAEAKGDEIWKESMEKKNRKPFPSGDLIFGDRTLVMTDLSLVLGMPKGSSDSEIAREVSNLQCSAIKGPRLNVKSIPLDAGKTFTELPGQSWSITPDKSETTELILEDGVLWRLQDTLIEFRKTEKEEVFFMVQGKAVATSTNLEPVEISGELKAKIVDPSAKPAPRAP